MQYFGTPYPREGRPAPIYENAALVETPVAQLCRYCNKLIMEGDSGFMIAEWKRADAEHVTTELRPWHRRCLHLSTFGEEILTIIEKENGPL